MLILKDKKQTMAYHFIIVNANFRLILQIQFLKELGPIAVPIVSSILLKEIENFSHLKIKSNARHAVCGH